MEFDVHKANKTIPGKFPWKGTSNDFTCELGEYVLRVEQMDFGKWWWCVY